MRQLSTRFRISFKPISQENRIGTCTGLTVNSLFLLDDGKGGLLADHQTSCSAVSILSCVPLHTTTFVSRPHQYRLL